MHTLSETIDTLRDALEEAETLTTGALLEIFHERGIAFFLLVFSLPMALPFPDLPGLSAILATPMILLTARQALGRDTVWVPGFLQRRRLPRHFLLDMTKAAAPWARRMDRLIRPRLSKLTEGVFYRISGLCGLVLSLTACLPIPFTHTVPSLAIFIMAAGLLLRDGAAVLGGMVLGTAWLSALLFLGRAGLEALASAF